MRLTCFKSEYLEIDSEIMTLAEELLSVEDIQKAEELSLALTNKSTRENAIRTLKKIVGDRPKRPLYYVNNDLNALPRWTRHTVEDIGHFIDQLVKCLAIEKMSKPNCGIKPLGTNLNMIQNIIPYDLYSELDKYNKLLYVPAKHDFSVKNRSHRFTCKEAVFSIFISLKLKEKIIDISEEARSYAEGL